MDSFARIFSTLACILPCLSDCLVPCLLARLCQDVMNGNSGDDTIYGRYGKDAIIGGLGKPGRAKAISIHTYIYMYLHLSINTIALRLFPPCSTQARTSSWVATKATSSTVAPLIRLSASASRTAFTHRTEPLRIEPATS